MEGGGEGGRNGGEEKGALRSCFESNHAQRERYLAVGRFSLAFTCLASCLEIVDLLIVDC